MSLLGPPADYDDPESHALVLGGRLHDLDHLRVPERGQNVSWGIWGSGKGKSVG